MSSTIDLNKISKVYLQGFKSCEIANQVLRVIIQQGVEKGILTKQDIDKFKMEECRNTSTFMLSDPLLSLSRKDRLGRDRYYATPLDCYGEKLYLNNQWGPDINRKDNLINWIMNWISLHGSLKIHIFKPCLNIPFGQDSKTENVYYEDVPINKQVPNLCGYIEELYGDILRRFRELFKEYIDVHEEFDTIPVILSDECPSFTWKKSDKYIAKEITKLSEKHSPLDYNEVYKIIKNRTVCDRLLGKFIHPNPHIKIYYMNFNTSNVDEFFAMIYNTLAHEIMHYFEYKYCLKNNVKPFSIDCLSESLAEMFALIISIYRKAPMDLLVAERRFDLWRNLCDSGWPYADALNFFIVNNREMPFTDIYLDYVYHGSIDKLQEVFGKCIDPNEAYKILLTY